MNKNTQNQKCYENQKWYESFNDVAFTNYIESGEATCVHIVRDNANNINTTGKWIVVISCTHGFNQITIELFPRITHPKYTNDIYENRYLCWHAAHDDIAVHRRKGHHGKKYIVQCKQVELQNKDGKIYIDYKVIGVRAIK